ncbi:hypothetical protein BST28156_00132 [Burkholderia stagnalis]|nr:hypothetical protein BST28156_00132 [Burkholderia stagnalis]
MEKVNGQKITQNINPKKKYKMLLYWKPQTTVI